MRRFTLFLLGAGLLLGAAGCKHCGKCKLFNRSGSTRLDSPAPVGGSDPLLIPPPAGGLPAPSIDAPSARPATDLPAPVLPESKSEKLPETNKGKELHLPDPLPKGFLEGPAEVKKPESTSQSPPKAMPAPGLGGFSLVRDGVATGRLPSLDGFDALKDSGYKSVVLLHAGANDTSAAKALAEKRGLKFLAVAVDEDNLKTAFTKFAETIGEASNRPLYVCDADGARTGPMWYAYFRTVDGLADDAALVKAAGLGLRDGGPEKDKLLAAVQSYLATR